MAAVDFVGKAVIITGSSSGIGLETAVEFARQGANVLLHGRDESTLSSALKRCQEVAQSGAKFCTVRGDLLKDETLTEIHKTAVQEFRRIDILVNNAGAGSGGDQSLTSEVPQMEGFDHQIRLLLRAPILLSQLCFPQLKESKGNILNISSIAGGVLPAMAYYSIAKAGLNMFTKCAALEFGSQGVRVNAVCPGFVITNIARGKFADEQAKVDRYKELAKAVPLQKYITPEESAKLNVFITSDGASMMNGSCIIHDGGSSLIGLDTKTLQNAAK